MKLRHELKYSLSAEVAALLFKELSSHCVPDPFAGKNGSYEVSSLYYDTSDFRFYWDREESVGYRRKVRLRSYNSEGRSTGCFLEIKEKHKHLVSKKRIAISLEGLESTRVDDRTSLEDVLAGVPDSAEVREVKYLHRVLRLQPIAIIRYVRDTLMSERDNGLRITYDRRLTTRGKDLFRYNSERELFIHSSDSGILEIKANTGIPLWLQSIVAEYGLMQSRFSKYCLAVKRLHGEAPARLFTSLTESPEEEEILMLPAVVGG
jgi:hypothetical protein